MGTKNNPGAYDCYDKADPDEPMFILLARDPLAPGLVRKWAEARRMNQDHDDDKIAEALRCAEAMEAWHSTISDATGERVPGPEQEAEPVLEREED